MSKMQQFADELYRYFAEHGIKFERYYSVVNDWVVIEQPIDHEYAPGVPAVEVFQGMIIPTTMHGRAWPESYGLSIFVSEDWQRTEVADGWIPYWAKYYIHRGTIEPDTA